MDLSIVSSLYLTAPYLEEFHHRVSAAARTVAANYELILVNDGSPDEALEIALRLQCGDPRLTVIDLSRNFGQHKAMMTGLAHSRGRLVFLLDSDLEEEPEMLPAFIAAMEREDVDVVFGVQAKRKGGLFERLSGSLFYRLLNWLIGLRVPPNQLMARLMTRRYVESLVAHRDHEIFLAGLCAATGYRQLGVEVSKRHRGQTSYTLRRKLAIAVRAVTSFSSRPLEMIFHLGTTILVVSMAASVILVARRLSGHLLPGWASVMVVLCFMGGLNLFCVGIVGIYLAKVFSETKDRPYTIVRQIYPNSVATAQRDGGAIATSPPS